MVKILTVFVAMLPALALAQEYVMYETTYLKVRPGHSQQFNEAMKAHNDRYHASGPHQATVWYIGTGPRSGQMFWVMGPTTFTALDDRPSSAEHQTDWADNVLSHAEAGEIEYWRMDPELSHNASTDPPPLLRARVFDIARGHDDRFEDLQRKLREVDKAKNRSATIAVFRTVGFSGTGRDFAVVRYYDDWAELDAGGGGTFVSDYEDVHGQGSWAEWMRDINDVVIHVEDEMHQLIPELSFEAETTSNE